jgi:membrane-associated protease RseP (regulator of RpoE activity)
MTGQHTAGGWFERLMASGYGRLIRVGMGVLIIALALTFLGGTLQYAVAALGLVPIAAGVLNLCPVAPIWGGHFIGAKYCSRNDERR